MQKTASRSAVLLMYEKDKTQESQSAHRDSFILFYLSYRSISPVWSEYLPLRVFTYSLFIILMVTRNKFGSFRTKDT